jgi:hypothetical protein
MVSPVRRYRFSLLAGAALVTLGLGASGLAAAATADAAVTGASVDGVCPDTDGVTVVVDFKELGGSTIVRCVTEDVGKGFTGLDALHAAGIPVQGVSRWGEGFVCRLAGRPSAAEDIPVEGDAGYSEACINTPPTTAYWSYWSARAGGAWAYSSIGLKNRDVIPGGFEGWSFSLNRTSPPQPGVAPRRDTPSATPRPSTGSGGSKTKPSTAPTRPGSSSSAPGRASGSPRGTSGGAASPGSPSRGGQAAASAQVPTSSGVPTQPTALGATGTAVVTAGPTSGATPPPSATPAPSAPGGTAPSGDAPPSGTTVVPASASGPVDEGGGSPVALVVGVLLVGVPLAGAVVAARRRRGSTGT